MDTRIEELQDALEEMMSELKQAAVSHQDEDARDAIDQAANVIRKIGEAARELFKRQGADSPCS